MPKWFKTELIGKSAISSHYDRCNSCRRFKRLNSYTTTRFATVFNIPLIPIGHYRLMDECPSCGHRGSVSLRNYRKARKNDLKLMMTGFASDPDCPENCCHAIRTLMIYDEELWFLDIQKSYGLRFETNPLVQYLIAEGLCRFGDYHHAISHCRKAIVLGSGKKAEELLELCLRRDEMVSETTDLDLQKIHPESTAKAFIPLTVAFASLLIYLTTVCVSSFHTNRAWLINGSLRSYSCILDGTSYTLESGSREPVKLKLGDHQLQVEDMPVRSFSYSIPLIKQLLAKNVLIINPDAMALLTVSSGSEAEKVHVQGRQIHILSGVSYPLLGLRKSDQSHENNNRVTLFRPPTHMEMVTRLRELCDEQEAQKYSRKALLSNPATPEAKALLDVALRDTDIDTAGSFLKEGLSVSPALLPWHIYYQNRVMEKHPETPTLVRKYKALCKTHPGEPTYFYLLARVLPNRSDAQLFFEQSEKGRGMNGLGFEAVADDLFRHAEFQQALQFSKKALARSQNNSAFNELHEQILLALHRYDALLAQLKKPNDATENPREQIKTVLYLTCAGYHQEAQETAIRFSEKTKTPLALLNAIRFYAVGNMPDYLDCLAQSGDPNADYQNMIFRNRISDADKVLEENYTHAWWEHLILYCAAMNQGNTDMANQQFETALTEAAANSGQQSAVIKLLSTTKEPTVESIMQLDINAQEKALLCITMGYRFPTERETLNALSRKYNFSPTYPQQFIKKWSRSTMALTQLKPAA